VDVYRRPFIVYPGYHSYYSDGLVAPLAGFNEAVQHKTALWIPDRS
jgi:hypothetical protein